MKLDVAMNKNRFRMLWVVCGLQFFFWNAVAQPLDSAATAQLPLFTSLSEAMKDPGSVYRLSLRKNKLDTFPSQIFSFPNLQELDLSRNKIREIPRRIAELQNLEKLNLTDNKIDELPAELGLLIHLKEFRAARNYIEKIPPEMGKLEQLEVLDIWDNEITTFPDELRNLKSLKYLDLRAILIPEDEQTRIRGMLPGVDIYMSPACQCKW